ncbi:hypothetical protein JXH75_004606 [Salmonella enterica subsp. enterica serovar Oranienburg]|nr:hypothetical protein [Salmonella enterica subsp. enterica serovar Oranienburg]
MFAFYKRKLPLITIFTVFITLPAHSVTTSSEFITLGKYNVGAALAISKSYDSNINHDSDANGTLRIFHAAITLNKKREEAIRVPTECRIIGSLDWKQSRYAILKTYGGERDWETSLFTDETGNHWNAASFGLTNVISATYADKGTEGKGSTLWTERGNTVVRANYECIGVGNNPSFDFRSNVVATGHNVDVTNRRVASCQLNALELTTYSVKSEEYISMYLKGSKLTELNKPEGLLTDIRRGTRGSAYSLKLMTSTQGMTALKLTDNYSRKIDWGTTINSNVTNVYVQAEKYGNNVSYPVQLSITYS